MQAWTGSEEDRSSSWGGDRDGSEERRGAQNSIGELYGRGEAKVGLLFEHMNLGREAGRLTTVVLSLRPVVDSIGRGRKAMEEGMFCDGSRWDENGPCRDGIAREKTHNIAIDVQSKKWATNTGLTRGDISSSKRRDWEWIKKFEELKKRGCNAPDERF